MLCLIPKVFLLKTLWRVEHVLICLKCRTIDLVRHGWDFPLLNFFTFKIFLLSKTLLPLIMFLLLLNVKIGGSAKNSFNFDSVCKMCQFLSNIYIYIYWSSHFVPNSSPVASYSFWLSRTFLAVAKFVWKKVDF